MMGLWARITGREAKATPAELEQMLRWAGYAMGPTKSGATVTWKTAMEAATALACARVIAEGLAQVPLKLYRETKDGGREPEKGHPLYDVLARKPNDWQTSFEFRETMGLHLVFCGNFFAFRNVVRGSVRELIPFEPGQVTVRRAEDGTLSYEVRAGGLSQVFPAESIWHVRGPSWNGWMGLEGVKVAREAIGLSLATEEAHARLHGNGVQASGILSVDGVLSNDQYPQLKAWVEKQIGGESRGAPLIIDRGAKWTPTSMTGVDSQHLETRRFQVEEICRFFRVMPIMVGYSDKTATYASAEQMFLAHVIHTMGPWYARIEQSADAGLLTAAERRDGLYTRFVVNGLMRGAAKDRAEFYRTMVQIKAMRPNEVRALEEMNPYDGGDEFPLMQGQAPTQDSPAGGGGQKRRHPFDECPEEMGYKPSQPRGPDGKWISTGATRRRIRRLVGRALKAPNRQGMNRLAMGTVTAAQVMAVKASTGLDLTGYSRVMDGGDVIHALRGHRKDGLTRRDIEKVPSIIDKATSIKGGTRTGSRPPSLRYEAVIGKWRYVYVEQVRRRQGQAAFKTMWKERK